MLYSKDISNLITASQQLGQKINLAHEQLSKVDSLIKTVMYNTNLDSSQVVSYLEAALHYLNAADENIGGDGF